jgi:predicted transcriptional regulator
MSRPYLVTSLVQLLAMISPGREDILDAVAAMGSCTVADLAAFIGRSPHGLYYHVRALRDCGLLLETHQSGEGKRATSRYDLPGRPLHVRYDLNTERSRRAVIALSRTRLRSASRGFARACRPDTGTVSGPRRNLWVARWKGWLSQQELKEANQLLWRLVKLLRPKPGGGGAERTCHEFTFVLAPIVPQPVAVEAVSKRKAAKGHRAGRPALVKTSRRNPRKEITSGR